MGKTPSQETIFTLHRLTQETPKSISLSKKKLTQQHEQQQLNSLSSDGLRLITPLTSHGPMTTKTETANSVSYSTTTINPCLNSQTSKDFILEIYSFYIWRSP